MEAWRLTIKPWLQIRITLMMSYPAPDMHSSLDALQSEKPGYGSTTLIKNIETEQRIVEVVFSVARVCDLDCVYRTVVGGQRVRY